MATIIATVAAAVKALGMGERAMRILDGLMALQATTAEAHRLPVTDVEMVYLAKYTGNSDSDVFATTAGEASRAAGKAFCDTAPALRERIAPAWRHGMATIEPEKLYKALQKAFDVAPATTATAPAPEATTEAPEATTAPAPKAPKAPKAKGLPKAKK